MQVSSKTSMSNVIFHNLESGSNELQSGFSENQLKLIEKADTQRYLAKCRIDHFTVVGLVTWPLNGSETGVDLVLIQTSLLLLCKSSFSYAN